MSSQNSLDLKNLKITICLGINTKTGQFCLNKNCKIHKVFGVSALLDNTVCPIIVSKGRNKGRRCCNKVYNSSDICESHSSKIENMNKNKDNGETLYNQCEKILKTGKNKGKQCKETARIGKNVCHIHENKSWKQCIHNIDLSNIIKKYPFFKGSVFEKIIFQCPYKTKNKTRLCNIHSKELQCPSSPDINISNNSNKLIERLNLFETNISKKKFNITFFNKDIIENIMKHMDYRNICVLKCASKDMCIKLLPNIYLEPNYLINEFRKISIEEKKICISKLTEQDKIPLLQLLNNKEFINTITDISKDFKEFETLIELTDRYKKTNITSYIRNKLNKVHRLSRNRGEKTKIVFDLFEYIGKIKKVLITNPEWNKFAFTVFDKLFELYFNEKCLEFEKYFKEIFQIDINLLKEYYNTNSFYQTSMM